MNAPFNPRIVHVPSGDSPEGRQRLLDNGYEPIFLNGKRPVTEGWSTFEITSESLSKLEAEHTGHANTGLRTGSLVVVDNDLRDLDQAAAVSKSIQSVLGSTIFRRVGSKGEALCYFNPKPIGKITISGRIPETDRSERLIEVLGQGQQVAAYGIHPDTSRPYEWTNAFRGGTPLSSNLVDLPKANPSKIREAVDAAVACLRDLGFEDVQVSGACYDGEIRENSTVVSAEKGGPVPKAAVRRCYPDCSVSIDYLIYGYFSDRLSGLFLILARFQGFPINAAIFAAKNRMRKYYSLRVSLP